MFPERGPGVALLLLRVSVAATFFLGAASIVSHAHWILPFAALISALLILGLLTPMLSALICLFEIADFLISGAAISPPVILFVLNVIALALLGPGAYSLDAWLFGRRVLVAPPENR